MKGHLNILPMGSSQFPGNFSMPLLYLEKNIKKINDQMRELLLNTPLFFGNGIGIRAAQGFTKISQPLA